MMPVMKNAYPIDQHYGPGYNIVDFYTVAPEYGTNDDFKNFIAQAHALGIKVILDVTPNHTSRSHPWSVDAHTTMKIRGTGHGTNTIISRRARRTALAHHSMPTALIITAGSAISC